MKISMHAHNEDKITSVARQMGKWVDHVLGGGFHKFAPSEVWSPAINVCENDEGLCVVVDIAGVIPEEIDLTIEENLLTVSGCRQTPHAPGDGENVRMHHMEIGHGPFSRTVELPKNTDPDGVQASYKQGFLWIFIPRIGENR